MLMGLVRALVLYTLMVVVVRLLGKRQIGQMEPSEFVVTMMLANLATIPMESPDTPIWNGVVPILLVFSAEMLMSVLVLHNIRIRQLFCGKPVILIENGRICEKNLKRTRVNLDELTMHLRENGIFDLTTVKYAILETNGQLSTLLNSKDEPATAKDAGIRVKETELPITVISDGKVLDTNLKLTGRDEAWVKQELRRRNCPQKDVLLMTVNAANTVYFVRREKDGS